MALEKAKGRNELKYDEKVLASHRGRPKQP